MLTHHAGRRRSPRTIVLAGLVVISAFIPSLVADAPAGPTLPPTPDTDAPPVVSGFPEEGNALSTTNGGWTGTQPLTFRYKWQRCSVANDVLNPGFEVDTAGWQSSYGATISRVAEQARSGSYSLKVVTPGLNQPPEGVRYTLSSPATTREYRFVAYVYYGATDGPAVRLKADMWGTDPTFPIRGDTSERTVHQGWNRLSLRFTPPLGTTRAELYVETTRAKVRITFYVDDAWVNSCVDIPGATSSTYTVTAADAGSRLSSVVDASNSAGQASFGGTQTDQATDKWGVAPSYTGPVYESESATNLPDSYIDTQVDDDLRFPVWTIGTSDADRLRAGRGYFTMIRTFPGTAGGERAVPEGQIGDIPGWCPHFAAQLCVFANATEILLDNDPSRTFEMVVPGRASWTH